MTNLTLFKLFNLERLVHIVGKGENVQPDNKMYCHSLPNNKILKWPKLKAFVVDIVNMVKLFTT